MAQRCPEETASLLSILCFSWVGDLMKAGWQRELDLNDIWSVPQAQEARHCFRLLQVGINRYPTSFARAMISVYLPPLLKLSILRFTYILLSIIQVLCLRLLVTWVQDNRDLDTEQGSFTNGLLYAAGFSFTTLCIPFAAGHVFYRSLRVGGSMVSATSMAIFEHALCLHVAATLKSSAGAAVSLISSDVSRFLNWSFMFNLLLSNPLEIAMGGLFMYREIGAAAFAGIGVVIAALPLQAWLGRRVGALQRTSMTFTDERVRRMAEVLTGMLLIKINCWEPNFVRAVNGTRSNEVGEMQRYELIKSTNYAMFSGLPMIAALPMFAVYTLGMGETLTPAKTFTCLAWMTFIWRGFEMLPRGAMALSAALVATRRVGAFLSLPGVEKSKQVVSASPQSKAGLGHGLVSSPAGALNHSISDSYAIKVVDRDFSWIPFEASDQDTGAATVRSTTDAHCVLAGSVDADDFASTNNVNFAGGEVCGGNGAGIDGVIGGCCGGTIKSSRGVLRGLSFCISAGSLVAVCGPIASGKSSLLAALLGELFERGPAPSASCGCIPEITANEERRSERSEHCKEDGGCLRVCGRIAFVPQQAWILCASLRDNITFGLPYDGARFELVVKACCLDVDINVFPDGADTLIGEGGATLSGGQKQRVSLARALYRDADVFLLDDVLSALDTSVAMAVFKNVMSRASGVLRDKTILFVTHSLWSLSLVEDVIVLQQGAMVARGPYTSEAVASAVAAAFSSAASAGVRATAFLVSDKKIDESAALPLMSLTWSSSIIQVNDSKNSSGLRLQQFASKLSVAAHADQQPPDINVDVAVATVGSSIDDAVSEGGVEMVSQQQSDPRKLSLPPPSGRLSGQATSGLGGDHLHARGVSSDVYRIFLAAGGGYALFCYILGLYTFAQALRVMADWWVARWSQGSAIEHSDADYVIGLAVIFFVYTVVVITRDRFFCRAILRANTGLHNKMFSAIVTAPMSFFWLNPSGTILNRFSKDMDNIDRHLLEAGADAFDCLVMAGASLIAVISIMPVVLVVVVPMMGLFALTSLFYLRTSRQIKRLDAAARSPVYQLLSESLRGLMSIRAFRAQSRLLDAFADTLNKSSAVFVCRETMQRWIATRIDFMGNLAVSLAALAVPVLPNSVPSSIVGLMLAQGMWVTGVLQYAVRMMVEVEGLMTSVERVDLYGKIQPEGNEGQDSIRSESVVDPSAPSSALCVSGGRGGERVDWPLGGEVEFCDVVLRYSKNAESESNPPPPALNGASFVCFSKEKIGIVGRTGAGKSSLAMALFRIVEIESGRIKIDGVDISLLPLQTLRSAIVLIPQDPLLFKGTLRFNLDPFNFHSDEQLWSALEKANMAVAIAGLPLKLAADVAENGENFSVGQRQLLCMARAILRSPRILLLDEATSSVDPQTDELIQRTIRSAFAECTVLTIAHRLNTIIDSHRVLVLTEGCVAEFGPPVELLADPNSQFSRLVDSMGAEKARELRIHAAQATHSNLST